MKAEEVLFQLCLLMKNFFAWPNPLWFKTGPLTGQGIEAEGESPGGCRHRKCRKGALRFSPRAGRISVRQGFERRMPDRFFTAIADDTASNPKTKFTPENQSRSKHYLCNGRKSAALDCGMEDSGTG